LKISPGFYEKKFLQELYSTKTCRVYLNNPGVFIFAKF
jgi:hypothetical protein